jgi:putative thioredoxin
MDISKVLERSDEIPVVVDFWAPWCGPCQFLGPVIEQLASESGGAWELVKINSDDNQEIARQYNIKGIPAVKMIYKQEVVAEFTGALPKHQIERWLEQYLPDERKTELASILDQKSVTALRKFVEDNPDFLPGRVALAKLIGVSDPAEAAKLVENLPPSNPDFTLFLQLKDLKELMEFEGLSDRLMDEKFAQVRQDLENEKTEEGVGQLIQLVVENKRYADELARKALVSIFGILGSEDAVTKKYRKQFDMALY